MTTALSFDGFLSSHAGPTGQSGDFTASLRIVSSARGQIRDALDRLTGSLVSVNVPTATVNRIVASYNQLEMELASIENELRNRSTLSLDRFAVLNLVIDRKLNDVAAFIGDVDQTLRESRPSAEVDEEVVETSRKGSAIAWVVLGSFVAVGIGFLLATEVEP